jgi:hypothetical protein
MTASVSALVLAQVDEAKKLGGVKKGANTLRKEGPFTPRYGCCLPAYFSLSLAIA